MGKYNFALDMNSNDTLPIILRQIQKESDVLEFGPANGRMTRYLKKEYNCQVDIVECDLEAGYEASIYAREACIGDEKGNIENYYWKQHFKDKKYDYIVFADVLEHLHDPKRALENCIELLKDDGKILLSVPNIAHNAVIAGLLRDKFDYQSTGLLDSTHVHFFSYHSIINLISSLGMKIIYEEIVWKGIEETEFDTVFKSIPAGDRKTLNQHVMGNAYQFVFSIARQGETGKLNIKNDFNYYSKLYYISEDDEEFEENRSIVKKIDLGQVEHIIHLDKFVKKLRLDPINVPALVTVDKIELKIDNEWLDVKFISNGCCIDGKSMYLTDDTYQILTENVQGTVTDVKYRMFVHNYEMVSNKEILSCIQEKSKCIDITNNELRNLKLNFEDVVKQRDWYYQKTVEIEQQKNQIEQQKNQIEQQKNQIEQQKNEIEQQNIALKQELNFIYNSRSWKLVQKIRSILLIIRGKSNG